MSRHTSPCKGFNYKRHINTLKDTMKRIITAICSLLLLQCAYGFDKKVLFIKDNVNLREDPNTSCKIEGKLWKGCMPGEGPRLLAGDAGNARTLI